MKREIKHYNIDNLVNENAYEVQDKIKGLDIEDYVYIPKWREQELLSQEEQLEDYKSRVEKAVEYLKNNCYIGDCINTYEAIDITNVMNILNGRSDE